VSESTTLQLDAREPYLADHRPGGVPLLPTALCLEALAGACARLRPGIALEARDVRVGEPCLVPAGECLTVQALLEGTPAHDGTLLATLCSGMADGPRRTHMRARFTPRAVDSLHSFAGGLPRGRTDAPAISATRVEMPVTGALVYRQFFHGPAYQVVASSGWSGDRLVARLAQGLPPLRRPDPATGVLAPRLLELALQAAGLLELARSGRSMIPHAIDSVQQLLPLDEASGGELLAFAGVAPAGGAIDIDVCAEADGRCVLRVRGYRTAPLPFANDPRSLAALAAALRACQPPLATTAHGAH